MTDQPEVHSTTIKVRGYHCDFYGHVNNARYLEFLEEARWRYLEDGVDLSYWKDRGLGFVVARVTINYRRPAGLNAELEISSWQKEVGRKSGVISQTVTDTASGKLVADAEVTFVIVDMSTGNALPLAGEILDSLQGIAANGSGGGEDQ